MLTCFIPQLLKKEVKAWFPLEHPHVAKLHGVVQLPASLAMVSPWCENGTIVRYLKEKNPGADRLQLVSFILPFLLFSLSLYQIVLNCLSVISFT